MRDNRTISDMGDMTLEQFSVSVNFFTSGDKILINGDPFNYIIFHKLENDYCLVNNSASDDKYSVSVKDLFDLATDQRTNETNNLDARMRIEKLETKIEKISSLYYYSVPALLVINIIMMVMYL